MLAALHTRAVEHGAVGRVFVKDLALEDAAVLEGEMEDITLCRVRPWIKPYDRSLTTDRLHAISHAAEISMTTEESTDSGERLYLRQLRHTRRHRMQGVHLLAARKFGSSVLRGVRASALVALVCASLGACSRGLDTDIDALAVQAAQGLLPRVAQPGIRSEVYAAAHAGAGSRLLVRDESIPIRAISASAVTGWLKQFDAVPVELRTALRQVTEMKPRPLDRSLFPVGTRFISQSDIAAAFGQRLNDDWEAFKRRYEADGWISFSDVLVTSDDLDALVYIEARCGSLCGHGTYIWLHRTGSAGQWSIAKSIVAWVS